MLIEGQIILVKLIAGSTHNFDRTIACNTFLDRANRSDGGRTADIASAIIAVSQVKRTLTYLAQQSLVLREVLIVITIGIAKAVCHHNTTAIDALPQADGIRIAFVSLIERIGAPYQLLRRETDKTTVSRQCRQRVAKAKTVGQEHVGTFGIKLLTVECLT